MLPTARILRRLHPRPPARKERGDAAGLMLSTVGILGKDTAWRTTTASRASFLIDGAAYFGALRKSILAARDTIALVGWDFDTRVPIVPENHVDDGYPAPLLELLNAVLRERPRLHVYLLAWDFSTLYVLERERLSLLRAVERLRGGERTLLPLQEEPEAEAVDLTILDGMMCDPERPIAADQLVAEFVPEGMRRSARRSLVSYAAVLLSALVIAAAWKWTPLGDLLVIDRLVAAGRFLRESPAGFLYVLGAFLVGALVFFPVTILIFATTMTFDPLRGVLFALGGVLASASLTYGIGRMCRRPILHELLTPRRDRLCEELRRRSFIAVVAARLRPAGSFSLTNLLAGALKVHFRPYFLGNLVGVLPGILGMALFSGSLARTLSAPSPLSIAVLGLVLCAILAGLSWVRHALGKDIRSPAPHERAEAKER